MFHGTVKTVGGSNNPRMFWEGDTGAKFEVTITLATTDPRMRPGLTAQMFINGDPRKDVLYVPRQALFLKDNKRLVYVRNGSNFDPREVKIQAENESRAAIEGISAGTEIALIDPTAPRKTANSSAASPGRRRRTLMATVAPLLPRALCTAISSGCPTCNSGCRICCCTACARC